MGAPIVEPAAVGLAPPDGLEPAIDAVGRALAAAYPPAVRHPARAIDARLMRALAERPDVRAALFRLVDAAPACRDARDLAEHLTALLERVEDLPALLALPGALDRLPMGGSVVGAASAAAVRHLAERFIVGATPRDALGQLERLWRAGAGASLDLLGEATLTHAEADRYAERCLDALEALGGAAPGWPDRPRMERDRHGPVPRANLSVKVSALTPLLRPAAPDVGARDAAGRLLPLLRRARDLDVHLHVDMESFDTLETTLALVLDLLAREELRDGPSAGLVVQAYLVDADDLVERILAWGDAHPRSSPLTVRLVKGAYWDHEVAVARQHGWVPPVRMDKSDTDRAFERLTRRLVDHGGVRVAVASHNLRSIAHAVAHHRARGHDDRDLEVQVLRGLGDDLRDALAGEGVRVRVYCPVGGLVEGMAYLVRRLLENTAGASFLAAHGRGVPVAELLRAP